MKMYLGETYDLVRMPYSISSLKLKALPFSPGTVYCVVHATVINGR